MTDLHQTNAPTDDGAITTIPQDALDAAAATAAASIAPMLAHATLRTASHGQMRPSRLNVRRKRTDNTELKALVRSHGLLHNLIGFHPGDVAGVRVEIVAGGRRHAVVGELIAEGALPPDYQIPYLLVTEAEAVEISLAENLGRADMHPADVFEAMAELVRRGRALDDIALAFRVYVQTVRQRLGLANVAPRLLALYRDDQADFKQMMALTITDDHAAQQAAWDSLGPRGRHPHELRRLLTAAQLDIRTDRLALYVGVAAYEKAGGVVTRDLFSDAGYIRDVALLERLAKEKMERQRTKLEREGAHWVELLPRADAAALAPYGRVRCVVTAPTDAEHAQAQALAAQIEDVEQRLDALEDGTDRGDDEHEARRAALAIERAELCARRRALATGPWPAPCCASTSAARWWWSAT